MAVEMVVNMAAQQVRAAVSLQAGAPQAGNKTHTAQMPPDCPMMGGHITSPGSMDTTDATDATDATDVTDATDTAAKSSVVCTGCNTCQLCLSLASPAVFSPGVQAFDLPAMALDYAHFFASADRALHLKPPIS